MADDKRDGAENGGEKAVYRSCGMRLLRAAQRSATFTLSGSEEGRRIFTADLYRRMRLACEGMSQREAPKRPSIFVSRAVLSTEVPQKNGRGQAAMRSMSNDGS